MRARLGLAPGATDTATSRCNGTRYRTTSRPTPARPTRAARSSPSRPETTAPSTSPRGAASTRSRRVSNPPGECVSRQATRARRRPGRRSPTPTSSTGPPACRSPSTSRPMRSRAKPCSRAGGCFSPPTWAAPGFAMRSPPSNGRTPRRPGASPRAGWHLHRATRPTAPLCGRAVQSVERCSAPAFTGESTAKATPSHRTPRTPASTSTLPPERVSTAGCGRSPVRRESSPDWPTA